MFTQHALFYNLDGSEDSIEGDKQRLLARPLSMFIDHLPAQRVNAQPERVEGIHLDAGVGTLCCLER